MAQAPVSQSPAKGTSVMVMFGGGVGLEAFVSGSCYRLKSQISYLLAASRLRRPLPRTRRLPQPFKLSKMILNVNIF